MAADTNNEMLPSSLCDNNNRVFIMTLGNVIRVNNSQKKTSQFWSVIGPLIWLIMRSVMASVMQSAITQANTITPYNNKYI